MAIDFDAARKKAEKKYGTRTQSIRKQSAEKETERAQTSTVKAPNPTADLFDTVKPSLGTLITNGAKDTLNLSSKMVEDNKTITQNRLNRVRQQIILAESIGDYDTATAISDSLANKEAQPNRAATPFKTVDPLNTLKEEKSSLLSGVTSRDTAARLRPQITEMDKQINLLSQTNKDNFVGQTKASYGQGRLSQDAGLAWGEYVANPTAENRKKAELATAVLKQYQAQNKDTLADDATLPWLSQSAAGYIPQFIDQSKARITGGVVGAAIAGAATGGAGLWKGFNVGSATASAVQMFNLTRGTAFQNLLEMGVDEKTAMAVVNDEAILSGLVEFGDTLLDNKLFGIKSLGAAALGKLVPGAVKQGAEAAAKSAAGKVLSGLAKYGINIAGEYVEEGTQEALSIANEQRVQNGGNEGLLGLAEGAAEVVRDDVIGGKNAENQKRVLEAAGEGAKIAAMFGGAQMIGNYAMTKAMEPKTAAANQNSASSTVDSPAPVNYDKSTQQAVEKAQSADLGQPVSAKTATVLDTGTTAYVQLGMKTKRAEAKAKVVQKLINGEQVSLDGMKSLNLTDAKYRAIFTQLTGVVFPEGMTNQDQLINIAKTASEVRNNVAPVSAVAEAPVVPMTETQEVIAQDIPQTEAMVSGETGETDIMSKGVASRDSFAEAYRATRNNQAEDPEIDAEYGKYLDRVEQAKDEVAVSYKGKPVTRKQFRDAFRAGNPNSTVTDAELNAMFARELSKQTRSKPPAEDAGVGTTKTGGKGLYRDAKNEYQKVDKKTQKLLDEIGKRLGITVVIDSELKIQSGDKKGEAARGHYSHETRTLRINPELGVSAVRTFRHELTHYIQDSKPEVYEKLVNVVKNHKQYDSIRAEVEGRYEGIESDESRIMDEVMAEYAEQMCTDEQFVELLAKTDRNLFEILRDAITEFFDKLKGVDPGLDAEVEQIKKLWADALKAAEKSNDKGKTGKGHYSFSSIASTFFGNENMTAADFESGDYKKTDGYKAYVKQCLDNMSQSRLDYDEKAARKEIEDSIDGIVRVALAMKKAGYDILDSQNTRDVRDSKKRLLFSSLEPNSDYLTSSDISTICDKRKNFAAIYDDIVRAEEAKNVPKGKRFFDNVDNYFYLHKMMADKGLTQPCRQCYVESMRKNLAPMASAFLRLVNETDANNTANDQLYNQKGKNKGTLKTNNAKLRENVLNILSEYGMSASDLTVETLTTADGLATLKIQAPLVYEAFNSFYGQSKPKMPKAAVPFRFGELTALLTDDHGNIKTSLIDKIESTGGFRLQSYSDFQIQNFVDVLQVIFEAGTLGLTGHAYTKVPAFLMATEGTGLKRNVSIFMYKDGSQWRIDKNDSFPGEVEDIYAIVESDATGNTSIIAVSQNEDMSAWIMANDKVGYGIPFHKSGLKMGVVRDTVVREDGREIKGYTGTKDHTRQQTEVWAKTSEDHKALTKVSKGINIYEFWDFENADGLSKNELIEKNVKAYIDACTDRGYLPKFREYVMNNSRVLDMTLSYAKQLGFVSEDAGIPDIAFEYKGYTIPYGYYKFLGDFGMFTPDGKAAPHEILSLKDYDFDKAVQFFSDSETLRRNEILQQFANDGERQKYRDSGMTAEQLAEVAQQKRNEIVGEVVSGRYAVAALSDGENRVIVDRDIFNGVAEKDKPGVLSRYLLDNLRGDTIRSLDDKTEMSIASKNSELRKLARPGFAIRGNRYNARLSAATHLDEVAAASLYGYTEDNEKPDLRPNRGPVDKRFTLVEVPVWGDNGRLISSEMWLAEVTVPEDIRTGEKIAYDVKVTKDTHSVPALGKLYNRAGFDRVSFADILAQEFDIVNPNEYIVDRKHYAVDSGSDEVYLDAVKRGDTETAQRMVDEAAKAAGYTTKLYHGTNAFGFTRVDLDVKEADGFSFWAANREDVSGTYTQYGRVRGITDEISDDAIDELVEEAAEEMDDAIGDFRRHVDRIFSEWVFGQTDNSYLHDIVDDANPEPGYGDGVYDVLDEIVSNAYYDYLEDNDEQYEDFGDWSENSEEAKALYDTIAKIEAIKSKLFNFDRGDVRGGIYALYANTDNMFVVDAKGNLWNELRPDGLPKIERGVFKDVPYRTRDVAKWARENGYDGVIFKNIKDNGQFGRTPAGDVYAFFKPDAQVKSADPVTYDDNGNVIPLSERFNSEKSDIRYAVDSDDDLTAAMYRAFDAIVAEAEKNPPVAPASQSDSGMTGWVIYNRSAGAAALRFDPYTYLLNEYGQMEPTGKNYREFDVPPKTADDNYVTKAAVNIANAEATPDKRLADIAEAVVDGKMSYETVPNKILENKVRNQLLKKGWDDTLADWTKAVHGGQNSAELIAMGATLLNNAGNSNMDGKAYVRLLADYAELTHRAGQELQAAKILKRLSPEGKLYMIQRQIDAMNTDELTQELTGQKEILLPEDLAERYLNAKTEDERDAVMEAILQNLADQVPASWVDKFQAWRYTAMLGNLRTPIRNTLGNAIMGVTALGKRAFAGIVEAGMQNVGILDERTTSLLRDKETLAAAKDDFKAVKDLIAGGGKYQDGKDQMNLQAEVKKRQRVFKNAALEGWRTSTQWIMENEYFGDAAFSRATYADALARYIAANGTTWSQASEELKDKARTVAIREAAEATFRDTNQFSQMVSGIGKVRHKDNLAEKAIHAVVEGTLPFKKTPANILVRAAEYSPAGLVNGVIQASVKAAGKGDVSANEIIDNLCKGLTGSAILGLGMLLADLGLLQGSAPDDEKEKELWEMQGHQKYAIEFTVDGKQYSYTIDWVSPVSIPLLVGAELYEAMQSKGLTKREMISVGMAIFDPMLEMSMLQGLNDALSNAQTWGDEAALTKFVGNAIWGYMTQFIPTLLGQAERASVNTRMTTYADKNKDIPDGVQRLIGRASAKIPGIDVAQTYYMDAWGRTQANASSATMNIIEQFLSPGYANAIVESDMEKELLRLKQATGDSGVLISSAPKYFAVNQERKDLTAAEYLTYAKTRGQTAYSLLTEMTAGASYNGMPDGEKVYAVERAYDYSNQIAKELVTNGKYEVEKWVGEARTLEAEYGVDVTTYLTAYASTKDMTSLKDKGETVDNSLALRKANYILSIPGLTDKQRVALADTLGSNKTVLGWLKRNPKIVPKKLEAMEKKYG